MARTRKLLTLVLALALLMMAFGVTSVSAQEDEYKYGEIYVLRDIANDTAGYSAWVDYVSKMSGVKINIVWNDSTTDKFALMMSGQEDIDMTTVSLDKFNAYTRSEMLYPLTDLLNEYGQSLLERVDPLLWKWATIDGEIYAVPSQSVVGCATTVTVRQDWLDELEMEGPTTIDEMEAILAAMKEKYDCAPLLLQLSRTGRHYDAFLAGAFLPEGYSWWQSEDGTYLPPEMHPEYVNMIELMRKWFELGYMNEDSLALRANGQALVEANKVGVMMDSFCLAQVYARTGVKINPEMKWTDFRALSGKYDNGNYYNAAPSGYVVINANSKNPAGCIALLNWFASDMTNTTVGRRGLEGIHWEYEDPDGEIPQSFNEGANNPVVLLDAPEDMKVASGGMEFFDIAGFLEYVVATDDPYAIAQNEWMLVNCDENLKKYMSLDDKLQISNSMLDCSSERSACNTALAEKIIAIVTGAEDISGWEEWVNGDYQDIGMKVIIEQKNELIKSKQG